jgi:hypothetical protein
MIRSLDLTVQSLANTWVILQDTGVYSTSCDATLVLNLSLTDPYPYHCTNTIGGFLFVVVILAVLITVIAVSSKSDSSSETIPTDPLGRARYLQKKHPLIDGHNDLPWEYRHTTNDSVWALDLASPQPQWMTDFPRLRG